jgi:hypothetical protein
MTGSFDEIILICAFHLCVCGGGGVGKDVLMCGFHLYEWISEAFDTCMFREQLSVF